jgi:hypothetical protein
MLHAAHAALANMPQQVLLVVVTACQVDFQARNFPPHVSYAHLASIKIKRAKSDAPSVEVPPMWPTVSTQEQLMQTAIVRVAPLECSLTIQNRDVRSVPKGTIHQRHKAIVVSHVHRDFTSRMWANYLATAALLAKAA